MQSAASAAERHREEQRILQDAAKMEMERLINAHMRINTRATETEEGKNRKMEEDRVMKEAEIVAAQSAQQELRDKLEKYQAPVVNPLEGLDRSERVRALRQQLRVLQPRHAQVEELGRKLGLEGVHSVQVPQKTFEEKVPSPEQSRQGRITSLTEQLHECNSCTTMDQHSAAIIFQDRERVSIETMPEGPEKENAQAMLQERAKALDTPSHDLKELYLNEMRDDMSAGVESRTAKLLRNMPSEQLKYMF